MEGEEQQAQEESLSSATTGSRPPPPSASEQREQQHQRPPPPGPPAAQGQHPLSLSHSAGAVTESAVAVSQQARLRQQAHSPHPVVMQPQRQAGPPAANSLPSSSPRAAVPSPWSTAPTPVRLPSADIYSNEISYYRQMPAAALDLHRLRQNEKPVSRETALNPEREMEDDYAYSLEDDTEFTHQFTTLSGWSEVEVSQEHGGGGGIPPSPRSLHAAAILNGNMYVFGGFSGTERVNTFHAFNFAEKRWSPVWPAADSAQPPSPRDRHIAVAYGTCFYIQGGFDGRSRVSDFWSFDFSTMAWREINTSSATMGRAPSARHSHSAVVHGHSLYIAFGYDGSYKSDIHEFDFVQSRWSAVPAAGRRPRPRYRATAVVYDKYMIVYGGHDGVRHLSDTHAFDLETKTWSTLVTEGTPPIPRDSHLSVVHQDSMFVFAGSSGSAMNDLHELQLRPPMTPQHHGNGDATFTTPARWRAVNPSSRGFRPRHRFCHVGVVYRNSLYVFGGYDGGERLNDFVRFDFTVYDLSFEVPRSTLIMDLKGMINDSTMSDITFIVEGQRVYAHKLILMRCAYFQALFLGEMRESRMDEITLPQVRHAVFLSILEYLYTDKLKIPLSLAMEIFEAADLFCIPRLRTMCEKRMLQSISVENAATIFHAADMHSAAALRQKAKKYILSNFEEVSKSSNFEEMGRNNVELVFEVLRSR